MKSGGRKKKFDKAIKAMQDRIKSVRKKGVTCERWVWHSDFITDTFSEPYTPNAEDEEKTTSKEEEEEEAAGRQCLLEQAKAKERAQ
ncbi:hypothetical protein RHGRI_014823 [Rhododendron griersonianum]|uniref:Uncharacterized protein n=1 Tax=Rhododendron griersonianum TaxID=479676 RepID=A0AAV6KB32_9ERIC|nr:hypothetical protein RHGRI_014823 [Rhododendron griersonianum]